VQMWDSIYQEKLTSYVNTSRAEEISGSTPAMVSA
jgi:hypothetical protein